MDRKSEKIISESDEDTETLLLHAKNLIDGELQYECSSPSILDNTTPFKSSQLSPLRVKNSNIKNKRLESVKDARKRIQKEWDLLKNTTLLNDSTPDETEIDFENEILCGVVAYIEMPNRQRVDIVARILKELGASVKSKFTHEVTHVIFKNGSLETYKRAKLLNVHLVSVLWVEACKNSNAKISEKLFPVYEKNEYSHTPRTFRKFMMHKKFEYDERSGILYRKSSNKFQSLVRGVNDLNIGASKSKNINESSKDVSNKTSDSSGGSITLQFSLNESPTKKHRQKENVPIAPKSSEKSRKELKNEKSKTKSSTARRKLFVKNKYASFIRFNSDDSTRQTNTGEKEKRECVGKEKETSKKKPTDGNVLLKPVLKPDFQNNPERRLFPTTLTTLKMSPIKLKSSRKLTLVTTYLHSEENKVVKEVINRLGGFVMKPNVNKLTTHVVVGESMRTLNLLKGMVRGCWILDKKWVFESAEAGYWLAEEYYELTGFSKVVQRCRIQRQAFGKHFSLNIFDECGTIYVSEKSIPPSEDLKELLTLCGARLNDSCTDSDIIVGHLEDLSKNCVTSEWILDSITFGRCKTLSKYLLK